MPKVAAEAFRRYSARCPNLLICETPRRPANALNVEIGTPLPRCSLRTPDHWHGQDHRAVRWLASGGSPLVLGACARVHCPLNPRHCDTCGHRAEHHVRHGCIVTDRGWPCGCEDKNSLARSGARSND